MRQLIGAADNGDHESQFLVGVRLATGDGCLKDLERAAYYFELAAEAGDERAINYLEALDESRQPAMELFDRERLTGWFPCEVYEDELAAIAHFQYLTSEEPVRARARLTRQHGVRAIDVFRRCYLCTACKTVMDTGRSQYLPTVPYADFDSLLRFLSAARYLEFHDRPHCGTCSVAKLRLHSVDYHIFHSRRQRDLVVRTVYSLQPDVPDGYKLLWWEESSGYIPAHDFSEDDAIVITADALVRAIGLAKDYRREAEFLQKLKFAVDAIAGQKELLFFVQDLLDRRQFGLAEALVEAHTESNPDHAGGWYWRAEVTMQGLAGSSDLSSSLCAEIETWLERATLQEPEFFEAHCSLARLAYMRDNFALARERYESIIDAYPECMLAVYELGKLLFEHVSPVQALRCFKNGLKKAPGDIRFPLACASVCIELKMLKDARIYLDAARCINSADARIAELEERYGAIQQS